MYNRKELITAVQHAIDSLIKLYEHDYEIYYVDIRLQLFNGDYRIWTGDSQYDDDLRGSWGYGTVVIRDYYVEGDKELSIYDEVITTQCFEVSAAENNEGLAEKIVDEALEELGYERGYVEGIMILTEKLNPEAAENRELLKELCVKSLQLFNMKEEDINYWISEYFN